MPDITVNAKGPIFDGRAPSIMLEFAEDVGKSVAAEGAAAVRTSFEGFVQNPTGKYSRSIGVVRYGGRWVVNDGGMVYGPWLAGVGSRNATSRFKGYPHWRRAAQQLRKRSGAIARGILPRYVRRLKG